MNRFAMLVVPFAAAALVVSLAAAASAVAAQSDTSGASAVAAAPAPAAPEVGQAAPDFGAQWADKTGPGAAPLALHQMRGKVVVLAFYPGDRTSGCTAELTKFRDEYATLFGPDVVVLPISVNDLLSHMKWAKEMNFPFPLLSDPELKIGEMYGSRYAGQRFEARTVFVIGRDGKIVYRNLKFGALNEGAYTELQKAVAKARG